VRRETPSAFAASVWLPLQLARVSRSRRRSASALSPIIGGWLAASLGYSWLFGAALAASAGSALLLGWWLKDPRHNRTQHE